MVLFKKWYLLRRQHNKSTIRGSRQTQEFARNNLYTNSSLLIILKEEDTPNGRSPRKD